MGPGARLAARWTGVTPVVPHRAHSEALSGLSAAMVGEGPGGAGGERDGSCRLSGLGHVDDEAELGVAAEGPHNRQLAGLEVDVDPAEGEGFTLAEAKAEHEHPNRASWCPGQSGVENKIGNLHGVAASEPGDGRVPEQEPLTPPTTLAIDIGGTGLKASVLDADGRKIVDRVRTKTPYPCPPRVLIRELDKLTHQLPRWDRVSVGFPGFVRAGRVLTAPNLSTKGGPGTALSRKLVDAWAGFPLAAELEGRLGKPTRLSNDADMHGLAVISGEGLELVITLGTGLGTAVFLDGSPTPHLELALMPFQGRGTFQDQLGNRTRRRIGNRRWSNRVLAAVEMFDALLHIDRLYVGGGNAKKLKVDLGHRAELVDNAAGILGGIKLWELDHV